MKKLIIFLILLAFLAVSCSSSKKAGNDDADILPDDEATDVDVIDENDIADDDADTLPDDEATDDDENNDELNDTDEDETEDIDPCEPNPCEGIKNSTGECIAAGIDLYFCKCQKNYFWDSIKCSNPCEEDTCKGYENSTGECTKTGNSFICSCEEGYYWHGSRKGCLNDRPTAVNVCTGQTKCYDNEKEIPCPDFGEEFFGQDANYARLGYCIPQSFSIDNSVENEPVVIDNNLGLMWQQKIPPVEELYAEDALSYCENLVYGGYDDWRLPSMENFMTIADYGRYDPALDTEYFPDNGSFWTSTMEDIFIVSGPWFYTEYDYTIFDFTEPSTYVVKYYFDWSDYSKTETPYSFNIRCVRGDEAAVSEHHFIPENFKNNIVWNKNNNLIFTKTNEEQTWKEALKYCSELNYAGISDWRLPNIKEVTLYSLSEARTSTTKLADLTSDYSSLPSNLSEKEDKFANTFCVANDPCGKGDFWNGEKCAKDPCANNPCESQEHNKICRIIDENRYFCGCKLCLNKNKHYDGICYNNTPGASSFCRCEEGYIMQAGECVKQ